MKNRASIICLALGLLVAIVSVGWAAADIPVEPNAAFQDAGGVAAEAVNGKGHMLDVTHPAKNGMVEGYFVPVSWRDAEVEASGLAYPDNYATAGKTYRVTVFARKQALLERSVTGINYVVFTYEDILDALPRGPYSVQVEEALTGERSTPMRFFYERPGSDELFFEAPAEPAPVDGALQSRMEGQSSEGEKMLLAATTYSTYSSCATCYNYYYPGFLVMYVNQTLYSKTLRLYCNQYNYSNLVRDASYSGPVFVNIASGYNYKVTYYDGINSSYRCVNIYPFKVTAVQFP